MSANPIRRFINIINEAHYPGHRLNKIEANYTDQAMGDDRCGNCGHFQAPNRCEIVLGEISPRGWCKYYKSKLMGDKHGSGKVYEKWGTATKVSPEERGKYAGKSKAELLKSYNALKKSGPHPRGSKEFGRMRELAFAIRAKSGWGKVK